MIIIKLRFYKKATNHLEVVFSGILKYKKKRNKKKRISKIQE